MCNQKWLHIISFVITTSFFFFQFTSESYSSVLFWFTKHTVKVDIFRDQNAFSISFYPHHKTSSLMLKKGDPPTAPALINYHNQNKFYVCSPLVCYWELNRKPALLLEPMCFWGKQNLTVSLKRGCLIWSFITHFKWFGNNRGQHGLHL